MNILFTNCFQSENTGDNAIWKSMMLRLMGEFPDAKFTISSQKSEKWDMGQLAEIAGEVKVIPLILVQHLNKKEFNKLASEKELEDYLKKKADSAVKELKEADVVISQGGGYMTGEGMWKYLAYFYVAQYLKKPTFYGSQTFTGNLSKPTKMLARMVFNRAKTVVARELESYKFVTEYVGAKGDHIKQLPDAVFTIKPKTYEHPLPKEAIKIGIRGYLATPTSLKELARFADMAVETIGPVVFIPVGHGGSRNDIESSKEITKMMSHKAIVIEDKLSANELLDVVKDGILISDRYHGVVYAASACTPFVPITPDIGHKMPGLLRTIEYPRNKILSSKATTAEELFEYTTDVWRNRKEIRQELEKTIPGVKKQAELAYKHIIEKIKNEGT